ncbi:MAG: hypothetical protein H9W81_04330 [Enterococcus sp.]|nr:hypothetical protein [Enterococcus sp.]
MSDYPDNVIPFPRRPVPASTVAKNLPPDIHKILSEEPKNSQRPANLRYLSLEELGKLDFPIIDNPEVYSDAKELERLLVLTANELGDFKAKRLGEVIGAYVASIADMSYSEGLSETLLD